MKLSHIAPSYFKSASSVLRVISLSLCLLFITGVVGCSKSASGKKDGADLNEADVNALREKRFGEGGIPTAEGEGLFKDIHFDFDSSAVKDAARLDAEYDAKVLKDNPDLKVTIEGHCDERGTSDYNLTLGQERATAV